MSLVSVDEPGAARWLSHRAVALRPNSNPNPNPPPKVALRLAVGGAAPGRAPRMLPGYHPYQVALRLAERPEQSARVGSHVAP